MGLALLKNLSAPVDTPIDNLAQLKKGDSAIIIGLPMMRRLFS